VLAGGGALLRGPGPAHRRRNLDARPHRQRPPVLRALGAGAVLEEAESHPGLRNALLSANHMSN
jgi:hypothetical protein